MKTDISRVKIMNLTGAFLCHQYHCSQPTVRGYLRIIFPVNKINNVRLSLIIRNLTEAIQKATHEYLLL